MESNFIEKYVINELEALKKENKELKEKISIYEEKKTIAFPSLGTFYKTYRHYRNVNENSYEILKKAYEEKDFKTIRNESYGEVKNNTWNYEIDIGKYTILLKIDFEFDSKDLKVVEVVTGNDCFETLEEAQQELLNMLKEDLEEYEKEQE